MSTGVFLLQCLRAGVLSMDKQSNKGKHTMRIRDIIGDIIGAICVFAIPVIMLFLGHALGL